jgi:hypothetical protein
MRTSARITEPDPTLAGAALVLPWKPERQVAPTLARIGPVMRVGNRSGSSGYQGVMAEVSATPTHFQRYEIAVFRLAEIDAGLYGARGQRYRSKLVNQIVELKTQACGRRA